MLIVELICGVSEPYLKFKIPISVYCSRIYLQSTLYTVWCKILMGENFDKWASGKF